MNNGACARCEPAAVGSVSAAPRCEKTVGPSITREADVVGSVCGANRCLTAVDAVAVARSLSIEPSLFARLVPAASDCALASFALDDSDARYMLAMRAPCPFVLRTNDSSAFCGLSATRPVCRRQDDLQDLVVHGRVVDRWNAIAATRPSESGLGLADVCRYIMDAVEEPE
jgi:hypothetical protein